MQWKKSAIGAAATWLCVCGAAAQTEMPKPKPAPPSPGGLPTGQASIYSSDAAPTKKPYSDKEGKTGTGGEGKFEVFPGNPKPPPPPPPPAVGPGSKVIRVPAVP